MPSGGKLHIQTANIEFDHAYTRDHPGSKVGSYVMHDERRGRVHQVSSPQGGFRIRPGPDSNDSGPRLPDWRKRPARLVGNKIYGQAEIRSQFPTSEIIFERGLTPSLLSYAA